MGSPPLSSDRSILRLPGLGMPSAPSSQRRMKMGEVERCSTHKEECGARQESGSHQKPEDGQKIQYNDSGHKETPGDQGGW
jgi:hypothetical protein